MSRANRSVVGSKSGRRSERSGLPAVRCPAGNPRSPRTAEPSYNSYGGAVGGSAAGGVGERAPGTYERPEPRPTWEPTPSPLLGRR